MNPDQFWLENPGILLQDLRFFPSCEMTKTERLNAITRLVLVAAAILFFTLKDKLWLTVLITGLAITVVLYFFNVKKREGFQGLTADRESASAPLDRRVGGSRRNDPRLIGALAPPYRGGGVRLTPTGSTTTFRKR